MKLLEPLKFTKPERAIVVIFNEEYNVSETTLLSESALAEHWLSPEEDAAWKHLQHSSAEKLF